MRKSEWTKMGCRTARDKQAILSWFSPFCDDMTPESAEVLCDIETDREKKLRVVMLDKDGRRRMATRTFGKRQTTVSLKLIEAPPAKGAAPARESKSEKDHP